ncbi:Glucooligosaccharide oxidase [Colletotrichum gloeosporioides 23]|nr:Glucooligosaccharide oxidase [Colletotrichum gloeosporioides 23]
MFSFPVLIFTALAGAGTGAASSTPPSLRECLDGAGIQDYAFPSHPLYSLLKVKRWNLDIDVTPAVVTVPETAEQIAAIVACAQERGLKPAPGSLVQYSFALHHDDRYADMADEFKAWQRMIADPALPRKLASQVVVNQLGMIVSGTYYGTQEEWESLAAEHDFFRRHNRKDEYFVLNDWLGHMAHLADEAVLLLGTGQPTPIYCKSLAFTNQTLIPDDTIDDLFKYFDDAHKGSPLWFAYFDLEGGAINDVPPDATAYAHRDALFYMQSYVIGLDWGRVSPTSKNFIRGIADTIQKGYPKGEEFGVYAGYVDPELENGQRRYWGKNLPRLEQVKLKYDPEDVFSNPQSVRPAAVKIEGMAEGRTHGASASVSHDEL